MPPCLRRLLQSLQAVLTKANLPLTLTLPACLRYLLQALQAVLAPLLLRRMKEDVETLPEKEEVVVWVELTRPQTAYYKGIYSKEIATLLQKPGAKVVMPGLRNLAMELRKVCCHPVRRAGGGCTLADFAPGCHCQTLC